MSQAQTLTAVQSNPFAKGCAWQDGDYVPIAEAKISVLDWGFTKSDVTYDVVHVWDGAFFRLDDHLDRFLRSVDALRMTLPVDRAGLAAILHGCVARSGLRESYVAMVCTRGLAKPGLPRHPANCENRLIAYAIPWVWVMDEEMQARGAHLVISSVPRIAPESVDPTVKNYHWGDMIRAQFEATDRGADNAVLLGPDGTVAEGPGFNIFALIDGKMVCPDHGALEGVTRQSVLDLCAEIGVPTEVRPLHPDELLEADEVLTCTTAGGVMPVSRVNERIYHNDRPGPVSAKLRELYWKKHKEGWHATPVDYGDN
ncbi:aminotransferase class IV [Marinibaculum pumilum]|uniref:Probable branched-chain-amino-acid aminotransferase n=1 Tax=Marinibaculum pumilum TaxID=1766165 RepID=A0ABV7L3N9_9PROT